MQELFEHLRIADVLDIGVITVLVYWALLWLRRRASRAVAVGMLCVITLYVSAHLLNMYLTIAAFRIGFTVILLLLVVVFQQDIRRGFEQLSTWQFLSGSRPEASTETTDTLLEAISTLAKDRVGALVVLRGKQPIEHYIRGGVPVMGRISVPLLHSIFHPASQGHDGAVLIAGDVVEMLGVHLPLSKNLEEVGRSGTRHSAALGLAECCDALVIVVSEERGTVSVAEGSELRVLQSPAALKQSLDEYFGRWVPNEGGRDPARGPTSHIGIKLAALLAACGLWFLFAYSVEIIQRSFADVAIEYRKLPAGYVVLDAFPPVARMTVSGSERAFEALQPAQLKVSVDLEDVRGAAEVPLTEKSVKLPSGLSLDQLEPAAVLVRLDQLVRTEVPVQVVISDAASPAQRALTPLPDPARVTLLVPSTSRSLLTAIRTEPVPKSLIGEDQTATVRLILPPAARLIEGAKAEILVRFLRPAR